MSKEEGQESVVNGYKIFLPSSDRMVSAWSRGDMAVQEKYMQMCLAAVDEAVIKIKEGERDLWSLFTFLAVKRAEIAQELNQADKESIGILRACLKSPIFGISRGFSVIRCSHITHMLRYGS